MVAVKCTLVTVLLLLAWPGAGGSLYGMSFQSLSSEKEVLKSIRSLSSENVDSDSVYWTLFQVTGDGTVKSRSFKYLNAHQRLKSSLYPDERIQISEILVNNTPVRHLDELMQNLPLQLNHTQNSVSLKLLGYDENFAGHQYKYQLKGLNHDWVELRKSNIAEYVNLNPGSYQFVVALSDEQAMNSETVISIPINVTGPVWASLWVQYGALLLITVFTYMLFSLRRYYKVKQEMFRFRIAQDLHDDISSSLNSISFFADAVESKSLSKKDSQRFLKLISDSSREAKERMSDIIWVIHPRDDDWDTLLLKCKRYASDVLECKGVSYHFLVDGAPPSKLTMQLKRNTWLIFRELITNIAKHANPNHVEIRFKVESGTINLSIDDDGKGFDPGSKIYNGYGLSNIKSRVENLKGRVFLNSDRGSGTHWNLHLPI